MNGTYQIRGGNPLVGEVSPIPNKNALMGALPIAILPELGFEIDGLPDTSDVQGFLEIFSSLGIEISREDDITLIKADRLDTYRILSDRGRSFRGSFSLAGPLLARFGKAQLPIPGGCKLGARSVSTHINGYRELGITVEEHDSDIILSRPRTWNKNQAVWLSEASVTATISIANFAAGTDCEIEIKNAACEPHVCDVLSVLQEMGARIDGIGTNHLCIKGEKNLKPARFKASPDYVDVAGYCVAAGVTGGRIRVVNGNHGGAIRGIGKWLSYFNLGIEFEGDDVIADGSAGLEVLQEMFPKAGHDLPKMVVAPWPGFPVDVLPVMVTLATKSYGRILFQNWMYESGFDFIRELAYLGADIYMCDPQKIIVMEPKTKYAGGIVGSPGIIQGTKAIFLAALADPVETIVHGTDILKRRYPDILHTYCRLGADIEAVRDRSIT